MWFSTMGLCSHNGLLVMLLLHLCRAQDDALPSSEPALPSLGEVIDAVKAAFEQAVQISTTGAVREVLEQAVGELTPQKTLEDQSPAVDNTVDHTTEETAEEQAVVHSAEKTDVQISESSEQTYKEQSQEEVTQGIEPSEASKGLIAQEESSIVGPEQSSVIKPVEVVLDEIDLVQEPKESVVQDSQIVEVSEAMTGEINSEESPVKTYTETQKESKSGAAELNEDEESAGELGQGFSKEDTQSEIEERTAKGKIEEVEVTKGGEVKAEGPQEEESEKMPEGNTESEPSQEERQAVTAQMGADGGVVDMDEVEQEEEEQESAKAEEGVIEVEAKREQIEAGSDSQLLKEEGEQTTNKTLQEKTQQEPEVAVDTKGPIKLQEPVITKSKATGGEAGKTHEASDVNEIVTSRDPDMNDQGEPVLRNTVGELPLTPVLKLRLGETDAPVEEHSDSSQTKDIGQKAWKIGAIAAAFFLILQTAVIIFYILKCRRKSNRSVAPSAGGNECIECDANNTDATIPIDEQSDAGDLSEYSQVQQEDVAMTTIPLDSTEKNSSCDPRPSVV